MADKENKNDDELLNSSMFSSGDSAGGEEELASMFSDEAPEENGASDEAVEEASLDPKEPAESEPLEEENKTEEIEAEEIKSEDDKVSLSAQNSEENSEEDTKPAAKADKTPLSVVEEAEEEDESNVPSDVVTVRPVKFKKFEATPPIRTIKKNLDIMQDISMHISVELGRTKLSIKEVMDFEQGSIVELDKIAGEQVEVYVNGKLIAKGEVIVIEDRFGVRITSTNITKNTAG